MTPADEIRDALATPEQVQRAREYAASIAVTKTFRQRCRDGVYDDCPEVRSPLAAIIDGDAALAAEKARADKAEAEVARLTAFVRRFADMSDTEADFTSYGMVGFRDGFDMRREARAALEANDAIRAEVQHDAG